YVAISVSDNRNYNSFFIFSYTSSNHFYSLSLTTLFRSQHGMRRMPFQFSGYQISGNNSPGFAINGYKVHHFMAGIHFHLSGSHRSEEHTSELQSRENLVCRLLLEIKESEN